MDGLRNVWWICFFFWGMRWFLFLWEPFVLYSRWGFYATQVPLPTYTHVQAKEGYICIYLRFWISSIDNNTYLELIPRAMFGQSLAKTKEYLMLLGLVTYPQVSPFSEASPFEPSQQHRNATNQLILLSVSVRIWSFSKVTAILKSTTTYVRLEWYDGFEQLKNGSRDVRCRESKLLLMDRSRWKLHSR